MRLMAAILLLMVTADVFAYLDPGTGSMMLQVILGGIAAVGVAIKLYWHRILAAFGMRKKAPQEQQDEREES